MSAEQPEVIESHLPDETPERPVDREVAVSISPAAFADWSSEHREQLRGVLHVLGESMAALSRLPEEAREEALRKVGFQMGPVMTETLLLVERERERARQDEQPSR